MGLGGLAALSLPGTGRAEAAYPNKPIRLIVPFATGGGSDFIGRFIAHRLTEPLGQQVIVDNKPGAGGTLGIEQMVRSPNDGYTLGLIASSYTVSPSLYKFKFDPVDDITPIVQLSQGPMVAVVTPSFPVQSIKELIDYAKKNPGQINFASAGQGSVTHMAAEYFADMAGIRMTHVPYKGTGPAVTDTAAGAVDYTVAEVSSVLPLVRAGKLRALASASPHRLRELPDVPTFDEAGTRRFEAAAWTGVFFPAKVPQPIIQRVAEVVRATLASAEGTAFVEALGGTVFTGTPEQFRDFQVAEIEATRRIVRDANIPVE